MPQACPHESQGDELYESLTMDPGLFFSDSRGEYPHFSIFHLSIYNDEHRVAPIRPLSICSTGDLPVLAKRTF